MNYKFDKNFKRFTHKETLKSFAYYDNGFGEVNYMTNYKNQSEFRTIKKLLKTLKLKFEFDLDHYYEWDAKNLKRFLISGINQELMIYISKIETKKAKGFDYNEE